MIFFSFDLFFFCLVLFGVVCKNSYLLSLFFVTILGMILNAIHIFISFFASRHWTCKWLFIRCTVARCARMSVINWKNRFAISNAINYCDRWMCNVNSKNLEIKWTKNRIATMITELCKRKSRTTENLSRWNNSAGTHFKLVTHLSILPGWIHVNFICFFFVFHS